MSRSALGRGKLGVHNIVTAVVSRFDHLFLYNRTEFDTLVVKKTNFYIRFIAHNTMQSIGTKAGH